MWQESELNLLEKSMGFNEIGVKFDNEICFLRRTLYVRRTYERLLNRLNIIIKVTVFRSFMHLI